MLVFKNQRLAPKRNDDDDDDDDDDVDVDDDDGYQRYARDLMMSFTLEFPI